MGPTSSNMHGVINTVHKLSGFMRCAESSGDFREKLDDTLTRPTLFDFGGPVTRYSCLFSEMNITVRYALSQNTACFYIISYIFCMLKRGIFHILSSKYRCESINSLEMFISNGTLIIHPVMCEDCEFLVTSRQPQKQESNRPSWAN